MMDKAILASHSGLTTGALFCFILAISILAKWHRERGPDFDMALGLSMMTGGIVLDKGWWTVWKARYISRETSVWMLDHWTVFLNEIVIICGMFFVVRALSSDSPYRRMSWTFLFVVGFVMFLGWMKT